MARVTPQPRRNLEGYAQMMKDASVRVERMEQHLEQIVLQTKLAQAREYEDMHRVVSAAIVEAGEAIFKVPQGESWVCERLAVGCGQATVLGYVYRDLVEDIRLAETFTTDANGRYADSFSNRLWIPERTDLIIVVPTDNLVQANIQVRVLKRSIEPISAEEAYVLAGGLSEYEEAEEALRPEIDTGGEPEPERHYEHEEGGLGFKEPEPRPQPHFAAQVVEAVERGVQHVIHHDHEPV